MVKEYHSKQRLEMAREALAKKKKQTQPSAFTKALGEVGSLPGGSSMGAKKPAFFSDNIRI